MGWKRREGKERGRRAWEREGKRERGEGGEKGEKLEIGRRIIWMNRICRQQAEWVCSRPGCECRWSTSQKKNCVKMKSNQALMDDGDNYKGKEGEGRGEKGGLESRISKGKVP